MAILYRGYAQQKGFGANLVNIPDPSKRIRQQGLQALQGMQDELDWQNKQATRIQNALAENAQIEAQNRANNFQLRQSYSTAIHDQKQRNLQAAHADARTRQAAKEQQFQDLLKLTKTGAALWQQYDAKQKEDADIWQHQLWNEHGIGWNKTQALLGATDEVWQDSAQRERLLQKLGLDGVPDDVIGRLRGVNGYKKIALQKAHARRWAMETGMYYAEHRNTKVPIAGMEVDLSSARGAQVHEVLQLLDAKRRREAGPGAPSSKMMALAGGYEIQDRARAAQLQMATQAAGNQAVKEQWDDEILLLKDAIAPGVDGVARPGAGVESLIKYYAGGETATRESMRSSRHRVVSAIIHGLESNEISWEEIRELENHPMKIGGAKKTFSDFFGREWESIRAAGVKSANNETAKVQLDRRQTQIKDEEFLSELHLLAQENPDGEAWGKMLAIANAPQNNYKKSAAFITDVMVRGQNAANDSEALATIQARISRGETITPEEVRLLKPTPQMEAQIMGLVNKHNNYIPTGGKHGTDARLDANIHSLLKQRIPGTVLDDKSDVRLDAFIAAKQQAANRYKAYTLSGMSHEDALDNTRKWIADKILEKGGDWEPVFNEASQQREFKGFMSTGEWAKIDVDDNGGLVELANNRNLIYLQPFIDREDLEKKSIALNQGETQGLLPRSTFIESAIAHTPNKLKALQAEMAQIDYYNAKAKETGGPLIQQYPDWYVKQVESTYARFSPRAQRLLNEYQYCDINRAACESGLNPIYNKSAEEQTRMLFSDDENFNKIKGLPYQISQNLTTYSISEVLDIQAQGELVVVGRYGFNPEMLQQAIELTGISPDTKFTPEVQNKLFDAYFKQNGLQLIEGVVDPQERLLLESLHRSMTEEQQSGDLAFHEPARLRPEAYALLYAGGRYAA